PEIPGGVQLRDAGHRRLRWLARALRGAAMRRARHGGRRLWRPIALLALATALFAESSSAEAPAQPQRIVSLNVCVDQLLLLMVEPRRIAALTQFATDRDWSNMPREARGFRTTHGRVEEVLPLMPDLVIGGEYSAPETLALLRRVGQRVEVMRLANSIDGVRAGMRWVGNVIGEPAKAEAMAAEFARPLAAVPAAI